MFTRGSAAPPVCRPDGTDVDPSARWFNVVLTDQVPEPDGDPQDAPRAAR